MRHAGPESLDQLEDLLAQVRTHKVLRERKRGAFYRKSSGFLHFHEDPAGLFADVKAGSGWERYPVSTKQQRKALLAIVNVLLSDRA